MGRFFAMPPLRTLVLSGVGALVASGWLILGAEQEPYDQDKGEFHFIRMEYVQLSWTNRRFGRGRPWWIQDWPAAETHFIQGLRRLTVIDVGENRHLPLTDDRIFDYPWLYATQAGYWDLNEAEIDRLREYLRRGGFLVVDDFYGADQWAVFREAMQRAFPDLPIVEIAEDHEALGVLYTLDQRTQIPGLRHLRRGPGGAIVAVPQDSGPHWRGLLDEEGRLMVAANYNMDVGDAWEHADMPEYPEPMTALAYRFGINYIIYAMTH